MWRLDENVLRFAELLIVHFITEINAAMWKITKKNWSIINTLNKFHQKIRLFNEKMLKSELKEIINYELCHVRENVLRIWSLWINILAE